MLRVPYVSLGNTVIVYKYSEKSNRIKTVTMQMDKFLSLNYYQFLQYAVNETDMESLKNEIPEVKFMSLNKEK